MSDTQKRYLLSSVSTFVAVAISAIGIQFSSGMPIEWTATFWLSIVMTGVRAGVKAMVEGWAKMQG